MGHRQMRNFWGITVNVNVTLPVKNYVTLHGNKIVTDTRKLLHGQNLWKVHQRQHKWIFQFWFSSSYKWIKKSANVDNNTIRYIFNGVWLISTPKRTCKKMSNVTTPLSYSLKYGQYEDKLFRTAPNAVENVTTWTCLILQI